ncbi:MAG: M48 family metallopeptidase [Anaerolineales bacterium]|nr:M48 family metallopeptidase [Anaerolineales bacterium]
MFSAFKIIRSQRKTIALVIRPDGMLIVRAPQRATRKQINDMLEKHADWIEKKQTRAKAMQADFTPRQFVADETFPFRGKYYALQLSDAEKPTLALNGSFQLAKSALAQAEHVFEAWYRQQAREIFTARVMFYAGKYHFDYAKIRLSSARTRWGSCSTRGNINLTWRLVMTPPQIIDYVVVHELCHLREHNHSQAFWAQVAAILPDYKLRRQWLRENGWKFHWP